MEVQLLQLVIATYKGGKPPSQVTSDEVLDLIQGLPIMLNDPTGVAANFSLKVAGKVSGFLASAANWKIVQKKVSDLKDFLARVRF